MTDLVDARDPFRSINVLLNEERDEVSQGDYPLEIV